MKTKMYPRKAGLSWRPVVFGSMACACLVWSEARLEAGTWTKITQAPADMHHIMLLSDGTVMAFHGCDLPFIGDLCASCNPCLSFSHDCYRLTPDGHAAIFEVCGEHA